MLLLLFLRCVVALTPISIKGSKLYHENGDQFFAKGVAYSRGGSSNDDILSYTDQCQVDAGMMKILGVNTILTYIVDPRVNHDGCMQAFASQGIYVMIGITTPTTAINRATPVYDMTRFNAYTATIDNFSKYDNVLAFIIANELMVDAEHTGVAPYVKAVARDLKAYRNARGYRKIPLAYSAVDDIQIRQLTAEYLTCGDEPDSIELFGMNVYSWCGNSSYYAAGYDQLYEEFQHLNVPVMFTETGCNTISPRDFEDVDSMLGPVFQAVFSGAIVYEWLMDQNGYGIVTYTNGAEGFPSTLDEFNNLKTVFATANPTGTPKVSYTPSNSAPSCPGSNTDWSVTATDLPTIAQLNLATVTAVTSYATSTTNGTTQLGTASSSSGSLPAPTTERQAQAGFSTAAIAGIVVAACVVGIGTIIGTTMFCLRRRKRSSIGAVVPGVTQEQFNEKAELEAHSVKPFLPKSELDSSQIFIPKRYQSAEPENRERLYTNGNKTVHELG